MGTSWHGPQVKTGTLILGLIAHFAGTYRSNLQSSPHLSYHKIWIHIKLHYLVLNINVILFVPLREINTTLHFTLYLLLYCIYTCTQRILTDMYIYVHTVYTYAPHVQNILYTTFKYRMKRKLNKIKYVRPGSPGWFYSEFRKYDTDFQQYRILLN